MRAFSRIRHFSMVLAMGLLVMLTGCSTVNRVGANVGMRFTENYLIPPILSNDDVQMTCTNGEALAPIIYALGPMGMGADNDQLSILLYSTAALCSEQEALRSELRYMRASRANQVEEATDARTEQKRFAEIAARRQYRAYQDFEDFYKRKYDAVVGDKCPKFDRDFDELVWMMGSITGVQAVVNDINSQNAVGVPKDIAAKVERAMTCLDNEKWWGVPRGVRATIWSLLPGAGEGEDAWGTMKESMKIGQHKGVRLAFALYTMAAFAKADDAKLRDSLKAYAATLDDPDFKLDPHFKLIDKFGELVIMGISDRYWTEHTGSRTPAGSIGHFWDENQLDPNSGVKIDDLL